MWFSTLGYYLGRRFTFLYSRFKLSLVFVRRALTTLMSYGAQKSVKKKYCWPIKILDVDLFNSFFLTFWLLCFDFFERRLTSEWWVLFERKLKEKTWIGEPTKSQNQRAQNSLPTLKQSESKKSQLKKLKRTKTRSRKSQPRTWRRTETRV